MSERDVDPPTHYNLVKLIVGWIAVLLVCAGTTSGCSCHVHFSQKDNTPQEPAK